MATSEGEKDYLLYVAAVVRHFDRDRSRFPSYWELNAIVDVDRVAPIVASIQLMMLAAFHNCTTTWQCAIDIEEDISVARAEAWDSANGFGKPITWH